MELAVANDASGVNVSDELFGVDFKPALVHQVVTAYLAGGRAGTKAQRTRAQVRGGGKKPWRQKGTGRARAGTIRSPLWKGGGRIFAATTRDFGQKVNRKMYRGAMRSILAELVRQDRLVVVKELSLAERKTRKLLDFLDATGAGRRGLIVVTEVDENLAYSSNNIPYLSLTDVAGLDPVSLVGAEKVIVTVDAIKQIEGWLS
ncbi:50S ribosomal protein L4 [Spectribacter hydrogenoxidans]|uniref:Large ribosomal subunit protein uL4 n=1 Tax=Spectribacter hydrogenoxidans TaxID=3075608 RepID=A0ABU3C3P1_9GAMM|nr:50S ribosomal protein L4 [Salinisphaera sp. W335]MDT0636142.1 50S ribosomal protein L4 [Salinisphaera sp. W335]